MEHLVFPTTTLNLFGDFGTTDTFLIDGDSLILYLYTNLISSPIEKESVYLLSPEKAQSITFFHYFETFIDNLLNRKTKFTILFIKENENFYKNDTLKLIRNLCINYYTNHFKTSNQNIQFSVIDTKWWLDLKKLFSYFDDNMFSFIFILFPTSNQFLEIYDKDAMELFIMASLLSFDFIVELNSLKFEGSAVDTIIYSKSSKFLSLLPKLLRLETKDLRKRKYVDRLYNESLEKFENLNSIFKDQLSFINNDQEEKDIRIKIFKINYRINLNQIQGQDQNQINNEYLNRCYCIYLVLLNSLSLNDRGFILPNNLKINDEILKFLNKISLNSIFYLNTHEKGENHKETLLDYMDFKLFYQILIQIQLKSIKSKNDLVELFGNELLDQCKEIWNYVTGEPLESFIEYQIFSKPIYQYFESNSIKKEILQYSKDIDSFENKKVYLLENEYLKSVAPNATEYLNQFKNDLDTLPQQPTSTRFVDDFHYHNNKNIEPDAFSVKIKEFIQTKKLKLKNSQKSAAIFKKYADSLNDPRDKLIINKLDPTKEELEQERLKKEKEELKKSFNKNKSSPSTPTTKPKSEREKLLEERLLKDRKKFEENLTMIESPLQTLKFLNNLDYLDKAFDLYESYFKKLLETYKNEKEKKLIEKMEELKILKIKEQKKNNPTTGVKKSDIVVTADMINLEELELKSNEKVPYYQLVQNYLRYFNNLLDNQSSTITPNSIKSISLYLYNISYKILLFNDLSNCLNIKFKLGKKELPVTDIEGSNNNSIEFQIKKSPETLLRNTGGKPDSRVRGFIPDKWQLELLDIVDNKESALICAPTSSGKTFISFYTMESVLRQSNDGIVVFIAPTKALVNQMYAEVLGRYEKNYFAINHRPSSNKTVGIFTRDWRLDMENCQILITVPQCLEILFLSVANIQFLQRIKYVIFDEVHQVIQADGAVWERLLLFNPTPFLALSATLGNLHEFHQFLKRIDPSRNVKLIHYTHRFNDLKTYFISRTIKKQDQQQKQIGDNIEKQQQQQQLDKDEDDEIIMNYNGDIVDSDEEEEDGKIKRIDYEYHLNSLHPFASLKQKKTGLSEISNDLNLISNESHELYTSLLKTFGYDKVKSLDPQIYFANIKNKEFNLEKQHLSNYQKDLKQFYNKLNYEQKSKIVTSLTDQSYNDDIKIKDWERDITDIVLKLQQEKYLPVIVFCFNRTQCTRLAQRVYTEILSRLQNPTNREDKRKVDLEIGKLESEIEALLKSGNKLDASDELFIQLERLKSRKASLEYIKPQFGTITSSDIEKEYKIKNDPLTPALLQGIGVHHSGCDKNYLRTVEFLFRGKKIQLLFATSSLAVGVNMPASSVVFAGDSPYLNVLTYRQCAGRAGRRGFDLYGSVFFLGISKYKVNRLINSNLSSIIGNSVLSPSLCLSLISRYDYSANGGSNNNNNNLIQSQQQEEVIVQSKQQIVEKIKKEEIKDSWDDDENIKDNWDQEEEETKPTSTTTTTTSTTTTTIKTTTITSTKQQKPTLNLTQKIDIEILKKSTKSLLNNSFFLGDPLQVQFLFLFSTDYLYREGFLDKYATPLNFSGLITHLSYLEPYNFIFVALLKGGAFDNLPKNQKDCDLYLIHILSFIFCIQEIPSSEKLSPSILVLPPPPKIALNIIEEHNDRLLKVFSNYVNIYCDYLKPTILPSSTSSSNISSIKSQSKHNITSTWNNNLKQFKADPNKFKTIDLLAGLFKVLNISQLRATLLSNTYFSPATLPYCEISKNTNSYLLDFYKHGQVKTLIEDNHIRESDLWNLLKEFSLTLKVIAVALERRDSTSPITDAFKGLSERFLQKFGNVFNY